VQNYPNLEIACSNFDFESLDRQRKPQNSKVRILAILGSDSGLNLAPESCYLNSLPDAEVKFLIQPKRQQLFDQLWEKTWEIVFFAGHGKTIDNKGIIYLNNEDSLEIAELKHGFETAISKGLQLAIFNCCDSLGLAYELSRLSLPQAIVMREPVPDRIAREFLQYFLYSYAGGTSLYLATRNARERLQGWEQKYACASWLPVIYQNQGFIPPQWWELKATNELEWQQNSAASPKITPLSPAINRKQTNIQVIPTPSTPIIPSIVVSSPQKFAPKSLITDKILNLRANSHRIAIAGLLAVFLVSLLQAGGWMQASELKAFDRLMSGRVSQLANQRILIVTVANADIQYQQHRGMPMRGSLSDVALEELLTKIQPYRPKVIASDIIHDFAYSPELSQTIAATNNFVGICRVSNHEIETIEPPPSLPIERIGFSNLVVDPDGVIRRQLLGMSPDRICQSDISLSLRLALEYLDDIPASFNERGLLQIGNKVFPQLTATSGGYHLPKTETLGYQILLNYHPQPIETISLNKILEEADATKIEKLVARKIILIGVKSHNSDLHVTPYSRNYRAQEKLSGVTIHAQMTEQIINAVSNERQLLTWLPEWLESLWLIFWSIIGAAIVIWYRSWQGKALAIAIALSLLFGCSWVLFKNNIWILTISPALTLLGSALALLIYQNRSSTHN
jgi:CHASE2 domain-containing sensor protein